MDIQKDFQYNPEIEISASQIGISKFNWVDINSKKSQATALRVMKKHRFDVLPIKEYDSSYTHFYSTRQWNNYNSLNKLKINISETIYYRLTFKDLIKKFKNEGNHYYFLSNYDEVLGLVSYVNLNCQLVYNYLFFVVSDIERSTSQLLEKHISESEILEEFSKSNDSHIQNFVKNFNDCKSKNLDSNIFQQMYLQTVGITLKKLIYKLPEEYKKLAKFSNKFSPNSLFGDIRNKVMHPVRPILSDSKSIEQIDELLDDYYEIKTLIDSTYR